ncbi:MAG: hypothetical protein K2H64_00050 [Desulfovibrio sp.]|nr:hypothetical protein [Desulfovibrio sp.]
MATIRYPGTGRAQPPVKISYSMNGGRSWQEKELKPGQSCPISPNCDSLLIGGVPYDPKGEYEIWEGKIGRR